MSKTTIDNWKFNLFRKNITCDSVTYEMRNNPVGDVVTLILRFNKKDSCPEILKIHLTDWHTEVVHPECGHEYCVYVDFETVEEYVKSLIELKMDNDLVDVSLTTTGLLLILADKDFFFSFKTPAVDFRCAPRFSVADNKIDSAFLVITHYTPDCPHGVSKVMNIHYDYLTEELFRVIEQCNEIDSTYV